MPSSPFFHHINLLLPCFIFTGIITEPEEVKSEDLDKKDDGKSERKVLVRQQASDETPVEESDNVSCEEFIDLNF